MMQVRKAIPASVRRAVLARDGWLCGICKRVLGCRIEIEHTLPLWAGGSNDADNLTGVHWSCHQGKTAREAGERARADAAGKRHRGERAPRRPIRSRGFPKHLTRTFQGEVVPRVKRGARLVPSAPQEQPA